MHEEWLRKRLEFCAAERDVVTKRMIKLEQTLHKALTDFRDSLLKDPCEYCSHFITDDRCPDDLECMTCSCDCICKTCSNCNKWVWRGTEVSHAET